jgi:hypothetical protein
MSKRILSDEFDSSPSLSSLSIKTIKSLLFIKIIGPPLTQFDSTNYFRSWLLRGHHSAVDTGSKEQKRTEETSEEFKKIWSIFKDQNIFPFCSLV